MVTERSLSDTSSLQLTDVWKKLKQQQPSHTFHHKSGSSRIDRFYVSSAIAPHCGDMIVCPVAFTYHCAIILQLSNQQQNARQRSRGHWKLNVSILQDEEYRLRVSKAIQRASTHSKRNTDIKFWWEYIFKNEITKVSKEYCRYRAETKRKTRSFYQACLADLLLNPRLTGEQWVEFRTLKKAARDWEQQALRGAGIRSRVQDGPVDENFSIFHAGKANHSKTGSRIESLLLDDGTTTNCPNVIASEITSFYSSLFNAQISGETEEGTDFLSVVADQLPADEEITRTITKQEVKAAVLAMAKNKAPGSDGIPCEFYVSFWDLIESHFIEMFQEVLASGCITKSQGRALIRLIPKFRGASSIKDFRPISLLNTDYKIMASSIANRIKKTLPIVIGEGQKGGIPGRRLEDNLCLYRDVIAYMEDRTEPKRSLWEGSPYGAAGAIISVDFEKAYDRVDRRVFFQVMEAMGYPQLIIQWVKVLYSEASAGILNGEAIAGNIYSLSALRQGCPLSMYLYVIYIEPLLSLLQKQLIGIYLLNTRIALRALVDDLAIFISCEEDGNRAGGLLNKFCAWTGARVNQTKTSALGLGNWTGRQTWPIPWFQSTPTLKLLGVEFSSSIEETIDRVWKKSLGQLSGVMRVNFGRSFTLHQWSIFIKSVDLSRSMYLAQVLPCPPSVAE